MRRTPLLASGILWLACVSCAQHRPNAGAAPPSQDSLRVVPIGRFDFESSGGGARELWPEELSGIAWTGGDQYLAIGDAHAALHRLTVRIDPATGSVRSAETGAALPLFDLDGSRIPEPSMAEDREGIIVEDESAWIANEYTGSDTGWPSMARHRLSDGRMTRLIRCDSDPMLRVFEHIRPNRGFESLARAPDGSAAWTANEDALTIDGPASTDSKGGIVRLQKLDGAMRPIAQYAYRLDPYEAHIRSPALLSGREVSGLSELVALPDGRLIALERTFAGNESGAAGLRSRLYLVDVRGATDVSQEPFRSGLADRDFAPVKKVLLWEKSWGLTNSNFEGMTLGPELTGGGRLLLLVADNNEGLSQSIFTLRLLGE